MADSYIDLANRREVYIQRYASYLRNEFLWPGIDKAYNEAKSILMAIESINSITQRNQVMEALKLAVKPIAAESWANVNSEFNDYAELEAKYYAAMFGAIHAVNISVPVKELIEKYINSATLTLEAAKGDKVGKWSEFVTSHTNSVYKQMNGQIVKAYRNGESTADMIKRLYRIKEGILKNQAESLVRTGVLHYSSNARRAMVNDNLDIIGSEYPNVTFDNRTTVICISISERYSNGWPVNKSPIGYPPYHFNSVLKGEMVRTISGNKPIEDIVAGDLVLTHKGRYRRVLNTMRKGNDTKVAKVINLSSGGVIRVTDEHPLLIVGKGWVKAADVKAGDHMFKNSADLRKVDTGISVVERDPYNYPSLFDSSEVFSHVDITSTIMTSSVNFNDDLPSVNGKVTDSVVKDALMGEISKTNSVKAVNKAGFTDNNILSMSSLMSSHESVISRLCFEWVALSHSLRMSGVNFASFLCHSISPVVFSSAFSVLNRCSLNNSGHFALADGANSMNLAPATHSSVCKRELALDSSKALFHGDILLSEEVNKKIFEPKVVHWQTPVVESIIDVEYEDEVYNIEVEDDNTYLVNDLVVHNCRTIILYGVIGQSQIDGTKAFVGGAKGAEAKESFENRNKRLSNKRNNPDNEKTVASQVRRKGNKDISFTAGQVETGTKFSQFLRTQPEWFIADSLKSKTKAKAFIAGKLDLSKLTDRDLSPVSLKQLGLTSL